MQLTRNGGLHFKILKTYFYILELFISSCRGLTGTIDDLKKQRNIVQKDVATKKKANEACDDLVAKIKSIGDEIIATELEQKQV